MRIIGYLTGVGTAFAPAVALAIATGALDPTFGTNGTVAVAGRGLAVQTDGKIVALGLGARMPGAEVGTFSLARLSATGAIDFSRTDVVGSCTICGANANTAALTIQPDGRILSVGTFFNMRMGCVGRNFVATRHLPNGELDGSFGTSGVASVHFGEATGVALQPDGKLVIVGSVVPGEPQLDWCSFPLKQSEAYGLVRLDTTGSLDPAFGSGGSVTGSLVPATLNEPSALAVRPDGRIVTVGHAFSAGNWDWMIASFSAAGTLEGSALLDQGSPEDRAYAIVLQPDGNFVVGGSAGSNFVLARFRAPGEYDPSFGVDGRVIKPGASILALAIQPDGKIVAGMGNGDVMRFAPNGAPDISFGIGGRVVAPLLVDSIAVQGDGRIVAGGSANVVRIDPARAPTIGVDAAVLTFPPQSLHTSSPPQVVTITNESGSPESIASIAATAGFEVTHDCASLAAGASCRARVMSTPVIAGAYGGDLVITGSAGTQKVFLLGTGERSLVAHYYRSILRREPDAGGKAFWEGEAVRVAATGANINETWFAMAQSFFGSAEYAALKRDDAGFITDLYTTFFNRAPDGAGLVFWQSNLSGGMPREVAVASFMFSTEFRDFTQAIFQSPGVRKEIDTVVDFYRGILGRLPDDGGFAFWVAQFRAAQCAGAASVTVQAESISRQFALSDEYAARARTNAQYVGDLYNAFLRRGGDLAGVLFWLQSLENGTTTREQLRLAFNGSAEFQARVEAVIAQGCLR